MWFSVSFYILYELYFLDVELFFVFFQDKIIMRLNINTLKDLEQNSCMTL